MLIVQLIGFWKIHLVPAVIACLVAANQQDRRTLRIESVNTGNGLP
jgi:hypothetical protein